MCLLSLAEKNIGSVGRILSLIFFMPPYQKIGGIYSFWPVRLSVCKEL
jgi:hypothetical protein